MLKFQISRITYYCIVFSSSWLPNRCFVTTYVYIPNKSLRCLDVAKSISKFYAQNSRREVKYLNTNSNRKRSLKSTPKFGANESHAAQKEPRSFQEAGQLPDNEIETALRRSAHNHDARDTSHAQRKIQRSIHRIAAQAIGTGKKGSGM